MAKTLFTRNSEGEPLLYYPARNVDILPALKDREYVNPDASLTLSPCEQFLSQACLHDDEEEKGKGVKLMTVHASKGLEFPFVLIAGLEDGLFPAPYSPWKKNDDYSMLP